MGNRERKASCPWCQNWEISQTPPRDQECYSPEQFIAEAVRQGCHGIAVSYNEPTLSLDRALDVFRLARARAILRFCDQRLDDGEALTLLVKAGLDAMNVDIKGDAAAVRKYTRGMDVERIWRRCRESLDAGIHLEVTTLVIPTVNDSDATLREIASRIVRELGTSVPWHITSYFPANRFSAPPTPTSTLIRARQIGLGAGLRYVYTGNVTGF